ncbi:MAG: S-layer homology domain-containing protein [Candidatus Margulisiibacteriota bacterium]
MKNQTLAVIIILLLLALPAAAITDPLAIGVGARSLGMGRTYVGYAENADALFVNPAGLGRLEGIAATNMQANLMNDINFMLLGGAYPVAAGHTVGAGYVGMGTADIDLRNADGSSAGTGTYNRAVYFLSYGVKANSLSSLLSDNVYLGTNLKYFSYALSGSDALAEGSGGGFDMDLSLLYQANPWLSLGYTQQDLLPASAGGKVTFANGYEEGINSVSKLGSKVQILGDQESALKKSDFNLSVGLDADLYVDEAMPMAMHLGGEFWPNDILAVRMGLDQDPSAGNGVVTNLCGGLGVRYKGIAFDYAYHPYSSYSENATHYFSVSLVPEAQSPFNLFVDAPADKVVTKDNSIKVTGRVEGLKSRPLTSLRVNDHRVALAPDNTFSAEIPLKIGKNLLEIVAERNDGALAEQQKRILRVRTFADVNDNTLAHAGIEYFGTLGLIDGYPDGSFRPDSVLSRVELTTILVRATNLETPTVYGKVFKDIAADHWANKYLKVAKDYALTEGYPDGTFKPNKEINRAEGAVVIARYDNDITYTDKTTEKPFQDVALSHWAAPQLVVTKKAGMLDYITDGKLMEKTGVNRAQFTSMLEKTGIGRALISRLLDFEIGYAAPEEALVYMPNKTINHRHRMAQDVKPAIKYQTWAQDNTEVARAKSAAVKPVPGAKVNLNKLRAYLRAHEGTDIVGKAKSDKNSKIDVYVLGNGKFLYIQGAGVDIYDARAGSWKKLSGELIASVSN